MNKPNNNISMVDTSIMDDLFFNKNIYRIYSKFCSLITIIISLLFASLFPHIAISEELTFGISTDLSNLYKEMGHDIVDGLNSAFYEANTKKLVKNYTLKVKALDDKYEPSNARLNMEKLASNSAITAVIGSMIDQSIAKIAMQNRVLFFGSTSGATVISGDNYNKYLVNHRPSYKDEIYTIVNALVKHKINSSDIAVIYQDDVFGNNSLKRIKDAFEKAGKMKKQPVIINSGYARNTTFVSNSLEIVRQTNQVIKSFILIGNYKPTSKFIKLAKEYYPNANYIMLSSVDGTRLAEELCLNNQYLCDEYSKNIILTQVLPAISSNSDLIYQYKDAMNNYYKHLTSEGKVPPHSYEPYNYYSLEGYTIGQIIIKALQSAKHDEFVTREVFITLMKSLNKADIGLGIPLKITDEDHQMYEKVWTTQLDSKHYVPFSWEKIHYRERIKKAWDKIRKY